MEVVEKRIRYHSRADEFHLLATGDYHVGTKHCREKELEKLHQKIKKDDFALWLDLGDKAEFITPSDKRFDAGSIAEWVSPDNIGVVQSEYYCDIVSPNASKCLGLIEGNHEDAIHHQSHLDVQRNICKSLNVPDLGNTCFYRLTFHRGANCASFVVDCVFTHGAGCAITKGAKINRLNRFMQQFDAQVFAYGHVHDIITDTIPYLHVNREGKIRHQVKAGAMTGCYFSTYTQGVSASYGEKKGYPASVLGCAEFVIRPNDQYIDVRKNLVD